MDPKKIEAIQEWKTPRSIRDIQLFIGFANFYHRFIQDFSAVIRTMMQFTCKDTPFIWSAACSNVFHQLKETFVIAPILMKFNPDKQIIVECDAFDYVIGGVLSQLDFTNILRPVAYFSKKHIPAEYNYEIYDKELMAIIRYFEAWRPELEGSTFSIHILSDHKNLVYFMTTKTLNHYQARWNKYLSRFNFKIVYQPGNLNRKADALTRQSKDLPSEADERLLQQSRVVLKPENRLEIYSADFLSNDSSDILSNNSLSNIDN